MVSYADLWDRIVEHLQADPERPPGAPAVVHGQFGRVVLRAPFCLVYLIPRASETMQSDALPEITSYTLEVFCGVLPGAAQHLAMKAAVEEARQAAARLCAFTNGATVALDDDPVQLDQVEADRAVASVRATVRPC
jgi:hypothetical protein